MLIIPAIDLRNGRCVRLAQGRKGSETTYDDNPIKIAQKFDLKGARMLHVVDLDGAFSESNSRNREVLGELIAAINVPIQFGGGVRSIEDAGSVLSLGVSRVVIGTIAVESPEMVARMLQMFGDEAIVVGIDARDGQVVTRGWESSERITALAFAKQVAEAGIKRIIYTDTQRDGMLTGVNLEQTRLIAESSRVKVTASGGISSLKDIEDLAALSRWGVDSVIVGKALYEGRFDLKEAMNKWSTD
jgi:phosphoribosylformimino-5-aminoimidazole carboxamide ribotide isomerase